MGWRGHLPKQLHVIRKTTHMLDIKDKCNASFQKKFLCQPWHRFLHNHNVGMKCCNLCHTVLQKLLLLKNKILQEHCWWLLNEASKILSWLKPKQEKELLWVFYSPVTAPSQLFRCMQKKAAWQTSVKHLPTLSLNLTYRTEQLCFVEQNPRTPSRPASLAECKTLIFLLTHLLRKKYKQPNFAMKYCNYAN